MGRSPYGMDSRGHWMMVALLVALTVALSLLGDETGAQQTAAALRP